MRRARSFGRVAHSRMRAQVPSNASIRARDVRRAGWSASIRVRRMRYCTLKLLCCIVSPPPANAGAPSSEGAECFICPFIKLLPFYSHHGYTLTNKFHQTLASLCRGRGTARRWWESTVLKLIWLGTDAQRAPLHKFVVIFFAKQ